MVEVPLSQEEDPQVLISNIPDLHVFEVKHELCLPIHLRDKEKYESYCTEIMDIINRDARSALYRSLCETPSLGWSLDDTLITSLEARNKEDLASADTKIADAVENLGDAEVRSAHLQKAILLSKIAPKEALLKELELIQAKALGAGGRLDALLAIIRVGLCYGDGNLTCNAIAQAEQLLEKGGDWERRNKLRVYRGIYRSTVRDFATAADLLSEALPTFTATELLSLDSLVFYLVLSGMLSMSRAVLKQKVIQAPEVLQMRDSHLDLKECLNAYYAGNYREVMDRLVACSSQIQRDRFLGSHYRFIIRALRLRVFEQFLNPYKSVKISSMANAFGVSEEFLCKEIASFASSRKLACKIDLVGGIIESDIVDPRNVLFQQIIANGDLLLNRVQKLFRVVDA